MAKSSYFSNALLQLIFNAVSIANIARDNLLGTLNLTVALHTASPGVGGTQATNEISYTGYARVSVSRTTGGWIITGGSVSPLTYINFPAFGGGVGGTVTHVSIGTGSNDTMLYFGALSPNIVVNALGNIPQITPSMTLTEA